MQKVKEFFKNPVFWCFGVIGGLMVTCTKIAFPVLLREVNGIHDYEYKILDTENIIIFVIFTVIFYVIINLINNFFKKVNLTQKKRTQNLRIRVVFFITMLSSIVVFLIAFLVYYPGLGMDDTMVSLQSFITTNQHPPIFQAVVYGIFHFIQAIGGSDNASFAVITLAQIIAASSIIAYFISWLYSRKTTTWIIVITAIFLIGSPLISDYTIAVLKDTWFGYAILLLLPNLYDFVMNDRPNTISKILLVVSLFGLWASRTNGQMVVILLCAVLIIVFFKNKAKRIFLTITAATLIIVGFCINLATSNRITQDFSFRESMSVPLAQVGAVINSDGNISQEEREFIAKILPIEKWKEKYMFSFVDAIKFDSEFDNQYLVEHKGEFLKTWASLFFKNPSVYARTYMFQTYGLWNLAYWDATPMVINQSVFNGVINNISLEDPPEGWETGPLKGWLEETNLYNRSLLSPDLSSLLDDYYQTTTVTNMYLSSGLIILICFGAIAIIINSKKFQYLILLLPIFVSWGSMMIATPASLIYRYNFYALLALPFIIIISIEATQKRRIKTRATAKPKNSISK